MQLVTEVAGTEAAFAPARPLDTINAYDILLAMRTGTGQELPLREEGTLTGIYGEFARIEKAERETASTITLLALANRVPARGALEEPKVVKPEKQIAVAETSFAADPFPVAPELKDLEPAPVLSTLGEIPNPTAEKLTAKTEKFRPADSIAARREVVMPEENRDFPL